MPSLLLFLVTVTVFAPVSIFLFLLFCLPWCVELLKEQGFCKFVLDVMQHKRWRVELLLKLIPLIHWKNSNVSINPLQLEGFHIALCVVLWRRKEARFMMTELSWQIFRRNKNVLCHLLYSTVAVSLLTFQLDTVGRGEGNCCMA